jgi:hypothetical protein
MGDLLVKSTSKILTDDSKFGSQIVGADGQPLKDEELLNFNGNATTPFGIAPW